MSDEIRKRSVARRRSVNAAASSSLSEGGAPVSHRAGSACGHSGCTDSCNVRYIGPVSHIRDHHALHAARGAGHVWAASMITGFAVVMTGAIAFQSAQAKTERTVAEREQTQHVEQRGLMERLDRLEALVRDTRRACGGGGEAPTSTPPVLPRPDAPKKEKPAAEPFGGRPSTTQDTATTTQETW